MKRNELAFWLAGAMVGYGIGIIVGAATVDRTDGTHGHACFANHTCRENLKCMVADGIDPTCVKP